MCERPITIDGYEVSCRECDNCLATYKNTWVARCCAELETSNHAYAITLTYADVNGEPPLGAKVFRYKDVQDMWKRIREQMVKKYPHDVFDLKYVVVGEKGTRFGRCHYHGVVFTTHPLESLGEFSGAKSKGFAFKRRLNWSLWGLGYVEFQHADRDGIAYVLKYILKGRMTAERSKGYRREGKTEWLASSYLWCSKKPAIGTRWLLAKLDDYVKKVCARLLSAFGYRMEEIGTSQANFKRKCVCTSEPVMSGIAVCEAATSPVGVLCYGRLQTKSNWNTPAKLFASNRGNG